MLLVCLPNSRHANETSVFVYPVGIWHERWTYGWQSSLVSRAIVTTNRVELVLNFYIIIFFNSTFSFGEAGLNFC